MKTIMDMAREAGAVTTSQFTDVGVERFAALVRADEREACAKACEKVAVDVFTQLGGEHEPYMKATAEDCAMQIREKGQPKRKWVGLTEKNLFEIMDKANTRYQAAQMTEAKLRELNALQIDPNQWAFDNGLEST